MNRHNAPPVVYPLGRSPLLGKVLLVFWLAGLLSVLLWWYATGRFDWRIALGLAAVLMAGLAARTSWTRVAGGQLAWDGDLWHWESASYQAGVAEHQLSVVADFQTRLLLRLENQARASLWLLAEQCAMPDRWLDLRRAVYSPHKLPTALPSHDFVPAEAGSLAAPGPAVAVSTAMHPVNVPPAKP